MYTEKEQNVTSSIIQLVAHEHHVPEAQVRLDMEEAMNAGRNNPNQAVQARWAAFHYTGAEPTLEEFILWATAMAKDMMG